MTLPFPTLAITVFAHPLKYVALLTINLHAYVIAQLRSIVQSVRWDS